MNDRMNDRTRIRRGVLAQRRLERGRRGAGVARLHGPARGDEPRTEHARVSRGREHRQQPLGDIVQRVRDVDRPRVRPAPPVLHVGGGDGRALARRKGQHRERGEGRRQLSHDHLQHGCEAASTSTATLVCRGRALTPSSTSRTPGGVIHRIAMSGAGADIWVDGAGSHSWSGRPSCSPNDARSARG